MSDLMSIELDIAEQDMSDAPGTGMSATEWVQSFNCTAVEVPGSCPGGRSYHVTGQPADLERLLADGGYEPLDTIPQVVAHQ